MRADRPTSWDALVSCFLHQAPSLLRDAQRHGTTYADLFMEHTLHRSIGLLQRGMPHRVQPPRIAARRSVVSGFAARIFKGDCEGFAVTEHLHPDAWARAAQRAALYAASAEGTDGSAEAVPPADATEEGSPDAFDDALARSPAWCEELVRRAAEAALSLDPRVRRVEATLQERLRCTVVATTEGPPVAGCAPLSVLHVAVTLRGRDDAVAAATTADAVALTTTNVPEDVAREAVTRAVTLMDSTPVNPGVMPVVLAPGWGGVWLHEAVGHLLEADVVAARASPFAGCLGRRVAPTGFTLVDDGTLAGGRATATHDDEGLPMQPTVLIEDGILQAFLTDRRSARALDLPRTGNGRRMDYRHPPLPRMTNLMLHAGTANDDALFAGIDDGLLVEAIGKGKVVPEENAFVLDVVAGRRIRKGALAEPIGSLALHGRLSSVLHDVVAIGDDVALERGRGLCEKAGQIVPVSVGMPAVRLRKLTVR